MLLSLKHHFDSAHLLDNYNGACNNLHGHRWEIQVDLESSHLINDMIIDFKDLKALINRFDHKTLLHDCEENKLIIVALQESKKEIIVVPFKPTAENLVKHFHDCVMEYYKEELAQNGKDPMFKLYITLWESPNASVSYGSK